MITRTYHILCCIMLTWSLEWTMFWVVSCCIDHDNKLGLKLFGNTFLILILTCCLPWARQTISGNTCIYFECVFRRHIIQSCFMLYHVELTARTRLFSCCIMLSWSWQQTCSHWLIIAFITFNSNLVPLLEGLCSSNPCRFEFSIFGLFAGI